jgi:BirA family biotin operon repressor/biotin-[acetyl-CoA-carboxylase] ligase
VLVYDVVDSTNERALRITGDGAVVVADQQTAGRGRHGRVWHSAPGLGLWFSVGFDPPADGMVFAATLSVRDALSPRCNAKIKWPNDILVNGKKVCGILLESRHDRTVLGIGINVHHRPDDFPLALRERAGSLETQTGQTFDRGELLREVLTALDTRVIVLRSGGLETLHREWVDACDLIGRRVRADAVQGIVSAIQLDGALVLDTDAGPQPIRWGELVEVAEV